MYFQPYGDEQQLNLNWIINEIINLHKQLDPDYETPSFTQVYPYSNLNRLNLDWILSELKALKELAPEPTPTIDIQAVAKALVALPFDSNTSYQIYDFISRDGEIWRATQAIAAGGDWDSSKWFKTKIGTDLAVLERWINSINNSLTTEIQTRQDADTALQNTINGLTSANISDDSDAGGANVKASLNALMGSLTVLQNKFPITSCDSISDFITEVTKNPNGAIGLISGTANLAAALHATAGNCVVLFKYVENTNRIVYTCCTLDNITCGFVSITGNAAYSEIDMHHAARNLFNLKNSTATVRLVGLEGEYQTIQAACDAANVDDIIIVLPGIYTEQVSIFGKKLHIIGLDKKLCTIIDHSGNYNTPPVEMNIGTLANFTIIEDASQPAEDETDFKAYCIHNDSPTNVDGETLEIANCDLINARHSCIGFGLYPNYTVYIHDCHMRKNSTDSGEYKYGCLYVHGCTQNNSTNQKLIVENCTISSAGDYAARVGIPGTGSGEVNARFIGNKMWSDINGTSDSAAIISSRNNYPFTLDKSCSGNTIEKFNIAPDYTIGTGVDLTNYGQGNYFMVPDDGYVLANAPASAGVIYRIYGKGNSPYIYNTVPPEAGIPVFVKKNMRIEIRSVYGGATVTYYPLNNI